MAVFSIIQKSELEGAKRLDAEYYQPEYFIDFTKGTWVPIGGILETCQYGLSLAMNDDKKGYPMFKMDDISESFLFEDEVRYADISPELFELFKVEKDDIFFNRVNSEEFVGRTGIYKMSKDAVFASYLIKIHPRATSGVLPDYLNIFLNSAYGQRQIRKYARRAVNQANVNAEELKQFRIFVAPLLAQKEIAELSNESWSNYEKAKSLYSQAEKVLLDELGLESFEADGELWNVVMLSDIKTAGRMDAEYFQPKYEKLLDKLGRKTARLGDVAHKTKKRPEIDLSKEYNYSEISDVNTGSAEITSTAVIGRELPANANTQVKGGELVVSKVRPTRGAVAIIPGTWKKDHIVSGAFTVFQVDSPMREYLLVVLRSLIGKLQMEKPTTGTSYPTITDTDVENILIPILPEKVQKKIAELVRESHAARGKARELLESAKRTVEELIESKSGKV